MDLTACTTSRPPRSSSSVNYTGVLTSEVLRRGASTRAVSCRSSGSGSRYTDLDQGDADVRPLAVQRPLQLADLLRGLRAPEGELNEEHRDNQNVLLKANYFLSTERPGAHNIVVGFDFFEDSPQEQQLPVGQRLPRLRHPHDLPARRPTIYPVFTTGSDHPRSLLVDAARRPSEGSSMRTYSAFLNDTWRLNDSCDVQRRPALGQEPTKDQAGVKVADDSAWSPRLAATFDPKGDGTWTVNAGFARYVMAATQRIGDLGSAGRPHVDVPLRLPGARDQHGPERARTRSPADGAQPSSTGSTPTAAPTAPRATRRPYPGVNREGRARA